jgi:hypothetical protein
MEILPPGSFSEKGSIISVSARITIFRLWSANAEWMRFPATAFQPNYQAGRTIAEQVDEP